MATGVEKGKLQMEEYNPEWAVEGKKTVEILHKYMPEAIDIRHVGSTAISGMFAKPIIDIAVLVDDLDIAETWEEPLKELGIFYGGAVFEGGREFGRDDPVTGNRLLHIHVVPEDNNRWNGYVDIVDYCNEFPEERDAYAAVKRDLLEKYADEPEKYGPAKRAFVDGLEERAFAWRKRNAYILMRLKDQAEDYPDKIAVCDVYGEGGTYRETSYKQLYELAGRTATKLKTMGVKRGTPVIVRMERRVEYIAAVYGILMARGIIIPAVPSYPESRIDDMKEDSGATLVISESFYDDIDEYEPSAAVHIAGREIVWINYTSGSTGKPKGVEYSFKTVYTGISVAGTAFFEGLTELNHASTIAMSFAAAAWDVYSLLYLGGKLNLLAEETRKDPALIAEYIEAHNVLSVSISPSMLKYFKAPACVKRVYATGQRVINAYSEDYETWGAYGCTECFTACLAFPVDKNYDNTPVGKPVGYFDAEVIDSKGNPLPIDSEGEIAIYGYTAEGYRGLEEATKAAFKDIGEGMHRYLTGDLGYKDENDNIVLLNRKDWMVKISGQRVDPAEIERAVRAVDGVDDCIVKAFTKDSGDAFLCAYYTSEEEIPREKLLAQVEEELPPYMMPAYAVRLDSIPLTASGKYDYTKLEDPRKLEVSSEYEAPCNELEKQICEAMEQVLGIPRVGRNDNFYEIGGDSIQTLALIAAIGSDKLYTADIYEAKTAAGIAAKLVECEDGRKSIEELAEYIETARNTAQKLMPLQYHYYKYKKMEPDEAIGNTPMLAEWNKDKYTAEQLATAVDYIIGKYDIFSLRLTENEKGEVFFERYDAPIENTSVIKLSDDDFEGVKKELIKPFDIVNGPLYRISVYETESKLILFADMHHVISDAYTQELMLQLIQRELKGKSLSNDNYLFYLGEYNRIAQVKEIAEGYYVLPKFDAEPSAATRDTIVKESKLTLAEIRNNCNNYGISPLACVTACALKAMADYNSCDKVAAEIMVSNRVTKDVQNTLGMFIGAAPIEIELKHEEPVGLFAMRVADEVKNILSKPSIVANSWNKPMLDDVININYIPYIEAAQSDWKKQDLMDDNRYAMNAMYVIAIENGENEKLTMLFRYNDTAYKRSNMEKYAQAFMEIFEQI